MSDSNKRSDGVSQVPVVGVVGPGGRVYSSLPGRPAQTPASPVAGERGARADLLPERRGEPPATGSAGVIAWLAFFFIGSLVGAVFALMFLRAL